MSDRRNRQWLPARRPGRAVLEAAIGVLALVGLLAPLAPSATAEPLRLVLDPSRTSVAFELGATLHTVRGTFDLREGQVVFDPELGTAFGEVRVDAGSGDTGIDARDEVMHEEILASAQHPWLVLRPERIEVDERGEDSLSGTLHARIELRGDEHPIQVAFDGRREGGEGRVELAFEVPWVAYGLPDPSNFLLRVEKTLRVRVETAGVLSEL